MTSKNNNAGGDTVLEVSSGSDDDEDNVDYDGCYNDEGQQIENLAISALKDYHRLNSNAKKEAQGVGGDLKE